MIHPHINCWCLPFVIVCLGTCLSVCFRWLAGQAMTICPWPGLISGCHCLSFLRFEELLLRFIDVDSLSLSKAGHSVELEMPQKEINFFCYCCCCLCFSTIAKNPCIISIFILEFYSIFRLCRCWREHDDWNIFKTENQWVMINIYCFTTVPRFIIHPPFVIIIENCSNIINYSWFERQKECEINRERIAFHCQISKEVINSTRHEAV